MQRKEMNILRKTVQEVCCIYNIAVDPVSDMQSIMNSDRN
jgi:hypothetical protein